MALYNKFFYNEITRKYIVAFGSLFNNIFVVRKNSNEAEIERESVPIGFGPKEKYIQRLKQDKNEDTKVAIKLPRLSYEMSSPTYAPERKLSSKRKLTSPNNDGTTDFFYQPVPYNFNFTLYVYSKTQEEGLQIIEQIIPFFTPDYTITMKLTDFDDYLQDIPISLNSVTQEDTYEGDFETRREIIWTLEFTLRGYYIGPKRTSGLILDSQTNVYSSIPEIQETVTALPDVGDRYPTYQITTIDGLDGDQYTCYFSDFVDINYSVELSNTVNTVFTIDTNTNIPNLENFTFSVIYRKSLSSDVTYNATAQEVNGQIELIFDQPTTSTLDPGIYIYTVTLDDPLNVNDGSLTGIIVKV